MAGEPALLSSKAEVIPRPLDAATQRACSSKIEWQHGCSHPASLNRIVFISVQMQVVVVCDWSFFSLHEGFQTHLVAEDGSQKHRGASQKCDDGMPPARPGSAIMCVRLFFSFSCGATGTHARNHCASNMLLTHSNTRTDILPPSCRPLPTSFSPQ